MGIPGSKVCLGFWHLQLSPPHPACVRVSQPSAQVPMAATKQAECPSRMPSTELGQAGEDGTIWTQELGRNAWAYLSHVRGPASTCFCAAMRFWSLFRQAGSCKWRNVLYPVVIPEGRNS